MADYRIKVRLCGLSTCAKEFGGWMLSVYWKDPTKDYDLDIATGDRESWHAHSKNDAKKKAEQLARDHAANLKAPEEYIYTVD